MIAELIHYQPSRLATRAVSHSKPRAAVTSPEQDAAVGRSKRLERSIQEHRHLSLWGRCTLP